MSAVTIYYLKIYARIIFIIYSCLESTQSRLFLDKAQKKPYIEVTAFSADLYKVFFPLISENTKFLTVTFYGTKGEGRKRSQMEMKRQECFTLECNSTNYN